MTSNVALRSRGSCLLVVAQYMATIDQFVEGTAERAFRIPFPEEGEKGLGSRKSYTGMTRFKKVGE